mgnify:CR=1 FL=1
MIEVSVAVVTVAVAVVVVAVSEVALVDEVDVSVLEVNVPEVGVSVVDVLELVTELDDAAVVVHVSHVAGHCARRTSPSAPGTWQSASFSVQNA